MCTLSMAMDWKQSEWERRYGNPPVTFPPYPYIPPPGYFYPQLPTQQEIDEFHRLLNRAKEYDKLNNQPDCELEIKKTKLKALAEELGVDIAFV